MKNLFRGACALLAVVLAGCSADRDVLIKVGNRTVTVDEFRAVARGNESQYLGTPQEAKAALFEDLLRRALLLHEAEQRGLFRDSALVLLRTQAEERLLTEAMLQQLAPARIAVSDAEVVRAVAWRDTASHMLAIYSPRKGTAEAAAAELGRGADFSVTADRFNPPGLMPPGGDFGFLTPGSLVNPLDTHLRTAPVGRIVGPFEAPGEGWFVIKVVERQVRPQGPFESQAPQVREMLRQRKRRLAAMRGYADLKQAYAFRLEPGAGALLFARYNRQPELLEGLGSQLAPPPGTEDETQVLARWDGGVYRLRDALDDLEIEQRPPDFNNLAALEYWIEQRGMRDIALAEARRRLLHQDPDIRRRIDGAVDNQVLQAIYEQDVAAEAQLIPLDVRAYYASSRGDFQKLDQITLETATLTDSLLAQNVVMHGGHAPDLATALAMANAGVPVRIETLRYPNPDPTWDMLQATFMSLPPGQLVGPTRTPQGWLIVRIVDKQQRVAEFDELEPMLKQAVTQQAEEKRRDDALRKVVDHLRRMFNPELHPEKLDRIPWPIEPASPAVTG